MEIERIKGMTNEELDNLLANEISLMKERENKLKEKDAVSNIYKAVREGDINLFRENVQHIDINKKLFEKFDVMEFLSYQISYRANKERYWYTKKYDGNIDSDIEMMKIVLGHGYDLNKDGNMSLYLSIHHNSTKVFKFLIDNGSRHIVNNGGFTSERPVYTAANHHNKEMMDILLSIGIEDIPYCGYKAEQVYQIREEKEKSLKRKKYLHYNLMAENEEYERLVLSMNSQSPMMYVDRHSDFKSPIQILDRIKEIFDKETGEEYDLMVCYPM